MGELLLVSGAHVWPNQISVLKVFGRVDSKQVTADVSCVNISHDTSFSRLW